MEYERQKSLAVRLKQIFVSSFCLLAVVCIISSLYSISNTLGKEKKIIRVKARSLINLRSYDRPYDKSNQVGYETKQSTKYSPTAIDGHLEEVEKQANIEDVNDENENENEVATSNKLSSYNTPSDEPLTNETNMQISKSYDINDDGDNTWNEININATVNLNYDGNENKEDSVIYGNKIGEEVIADAKTISLDTQTQNHDIIPNDDVDDVEKDATGEISSETNDRSSKGFTGLQRVTGINRTEADSMLKAADDIINKLSYAHKSIDNIQHLFDQNKTQNKKVKKQKMKNKKRKKNFHQTFSYHTPIVIKNENTTTSTNEDQLSMIPTVDKTIRNYTRNLVHANSNKNNKLEKSNPYTVLTARHRRKGEKTTERERLKKEKFQEAYKLINDDKKSLKDDDSEDESGVESYIPVFPENYHATGILVLPHSNIAEPFEVWFAPSVKKSRIDYYYGTDKTLQRADHGEHGRSYKYVPMYTDRQGSYDGCWTVTGTKNRPIIPQVITPNVTWFKYNKTEVYTGTLTTKWSYEYFAFGMRNTQHVWITKNKPHRPIRYEMFGFDMMLGSYYDHYVLEYISFEEWAIEEKMFDLPKGVQCYNWSSSLESSLMVNPMQEFTAFSPEESLDINKRYIDYKKNHDRKENNEKSEELKRMHIFKHNTRYINSHNRRNLPFKLTHNTFLDLKPEEMAAQHGTLEQDHKNHDGIKERDDTEEILSHLPEIPEELDWRDYGAVSRVKGQAICGSCYAFTAAGAAEGAWFRKTGELIEVSSQQIVDCSWGTGNHGCKGGHYAAGLSWIYTHGISTAKSYGKYLGQEGYCHFNDTWFGAKIDGFTYIQPYNITALKYAVAKFGPIAISLNTIPLSFKFYSHGVYSDPKCVSNITQHSALVVGYGKQNGEEYWLIKNSWSSTWGEDGYIKITMKDHLCGVTQYPIAALVDKARFKLPRQSKASNEELGIKIPPSSKLVHSTGTTEKARQRNSSMNSHVVSVDPRNTSTFISKAKGEKITTTTDRITIKIISPTNSKSLHNPNSTAATKEKHALQYTKVPALIADDSVTDNSIAVDNNVTDNSIAEKNIAGDSSTNNNFTDNSIISDKSIDVSIDNITPSQNTPTSVTSSESNNAQPEDNSELRPYQKLEDLITAKHSKKYRKKVSNYEHVRFALAQNGKIPPIQKPTAPKFESGDDIGDSARKNTSFQHQIKECGHEEGSICKTENVTTGFHPDATNDKMINMIRSANQKNQSAVDKDSLNSQQYNSQENKDENSFLVSSEDQLKTDEMDEPNEKTNIVEEPIETEEVEREKKKLAMEKEMKLQKIKDVVMSLKDQLGTENKNKEHNLSHKSKSIPFFGLHIKDEDEDDGSKSITSSSKPSSDVSYNATNNTTLTVEKPDAFSVSPNETDSDKNVRKQLRKNALTVKLNEDLEKEKNTEARKSNYEDNMSETEMMADNYSESVANNEESFSEELNNTMREPFMNEDRSEEIATHVIDLRKGVINNTENVAMTISSNADNAMIETDLPTKDDVQIKAKKIINEKHKNLNSIKIRNKKTHNSPKKLKVKIPNSDVPKKQKSKSFDSNLPKNQKGKNIEGSENNNSKNFRITIKIKNKNEGQQLHETKKPSFFDVNHQIVNKDRKLRLYNQHFSPSRHISPSQKSVVNQSPTKFSQHSLQKIMQKLPVLHVAQHMYNHALQKEKKKQTEDIKVKLLEHQKELHQIVSKLKRKEMKIDKSWSKPTIDPEKIGTYLDEHLKQKNNKIRPEQATLLGSKKYLIAKHASVKDSEKYAKAPIETLQQSREQTPFTNSKNIDNMKIQSIKKKKLSKVDKAYKDSMDFLYERIDKAVLKQSY